MIKNILYMFELSELQKDKLASLAEDIALISALNKVFKEVVDHYIPQVNDQNNELLGSQFRAHDLSKRIMNAVLLNITSYKAEKIDKKSLSRAK